MSRRADATAPRPLKPTHFHILLSLVEGPSHGYGIRREVDDRTRGGLVLAAGTLYETLQRLESLGWIEPAEAPPEAEEDASSRWRFYALTGRGRARLTDEVRRLESDLEAARLKLGAAESSA